MTYKLGEVAEQLLEISTEIANYPDDEYIDECPFCGEGHFYTTLVHKVTCPILRLRKLIKEIVE